MHAEIITKPVTSPPPSLEVTDSSVCEVIVSPSKGFGQTEWITGSKRNATCQRSQIKLQVGVMYRRLRSLTLIKKPSNQNRVVSFRSFECRLSGHKLRMFRTIVRKVASNYSSDDRQLELETRCRYQLGTKVHDFIRHPRNIGMSKESTIASYLCRF